jgi:FKBP-type peptidyl-prolyl cis-trans isomerase
MRWSLLFLTVLLVNCAGKKKPETAKGEAWSNDHSVSYQSEVNAREQLKIGVYLEHRKYLNMKMTSSGLRYQIMSPNPKGELSEPGKTALATVKISLLDGTICYETDSDFLEEIPIDHNDRESGLNEGLKLMRKGEKAKLILPSHLAHGLVGDLSKIPPLSILVIDVELTELQ